MTEMFVLPLDYIALFNALAVLYEFIDSKGHAYKVF